MNKHKQISITSLRNQHLIEISNINDLANQDIIHIEGRPSSPGADWKQLQLLAGHTDPKSILFMGATMGSDMIGAI